MAGKRKEADETQRIMQVLNHPLRRKIICFAVAEGEPVSPASASRGLEEKLSNVTYHVNELFKAGVFESRFTRPVRGAVEHFYAPLPAALAHPMIQAVLKDGGVSPR